VSGALRIVHAGPGVSLQDAGRWGYLRFGVTAAGPMDVLAHEAANLAAGAAENAAALEISVGGCDLVAEDRPVGLAVVSGAFRVARDGASLPPDCVLTLAPGQKLSIRAGEKCAWAYLAVSGRIDRAPELGSLSMHPRSGVGGNGLRAGDMLNIVDGRAGPGAPRRLSPLRAASDDTPIRIVPGPQDDYFDAENFARFLEGPWRVSPRSDRMAYALEGPRIGHCKGFNIVSDGIAFGAIQIPGDGQPFVQMADRAPTGGYPKIGTVIAADLGRLAQMRPGVALRFAAVGVQEAVAVWRRSRARLIEAATAHEPHELSSETLLALNLVGGAVSADDGQSQD
jgi:5-oxoprolinase (ATP-hydrolysing) subunit C